MAIGSYRYQPSAWLAEPTAPRRELPFSLSWLLRRLASLCFRVVRLCGPYFPECGLHDLVVFLKGCGFSEIVLRLGTTQCSVRVVSLQLQGEHLTGRSLA